MTRWTCKPTESCGAYAGTRCRRELSRFQIPGLGNAVGSLSNKGGCIIHVPEVADIKDMADISNNADIADSADIAGIADMADIEDMIDVLDIARRDTQNLVAVGQPLVANKLQGARRKQKFAD